jgi:hypothetical protein
MDAEWKLKKLPFRGYGMEWTGWVVGLDDLMDPGAIPSWAMWEEPPILTTARDS